MILKTSLRAKAGVPKTLVKQNLRLHSLYFPQNTLMLTESRGEFCDLHSIFRLRALRYCNSFINVFPRFESSACKSQVPPRDVLAGNHGGCFHNR